MDLLLVRHGVTQHNADRIFMGHDPVPLATLGREQVRRLGERLRLAPPQRIVSSDIRRAVESAEILAGILGLPFRTEERLREVDVGSAKGMSYEDAARSWPEVFSPDGERPFPGGESFAAVADRAASCLRESVIGEGEDRVLVVTHGGVVRGVAARLLGLPLRAVAPFAIDNASLSVFGFDARGSRLVTWNDTAHLGGPLAGGGGQWAGG